MLKYAFSHILETLFSLISDSYINTQNLYFVLPEKWHAEQSEAEKLLNLNCEKWQNIKEIMYWVKQGKKKLWEN